jgi:hypothetical protein
MYCNGNVNIWLKSISCIIVGGNQIQTRRWWSDRPNDKLTPAKFVDIVHDQPDADSAIKQAIAEFKLQLKRAWPLDGAAAGLI